MDPKDTPYQDVPYKEGRYPTPAEVEKIIAKHPELHKPLMFANHQKKFLAFTWITCIAMTFWYVFIEEYPQEEHCFSPLRRYVKSVKDKFFTVDIEEDDVVKNRIEELKQKLEAKKLAEATGQQES